MDSGSSGLFTPMEEDFKYVRFIYTPTNKALNRVYYKSPGGWVVVRFFCVKNVCSGNYFYSFWWLDLFSTPANKFETNDGVGELGYYESVVCWLVSWFVCIKMDGYTSTVLDGVQWNLLCMISVRCDIYFL